MGYRSEEDEDMGENSLNSANGEAKLWSGKCKRDVLDSKKFCPLSKATTFIGNKYDHWGNYAGIGLGRYSYPVTLEVDYFCWCF